MILDRLLCALAAIWAAIEFAQWTRPTLGQVFLLICVFAFADRAYFGGRMP